MPLKLHILIFYEPYDIKSKKIYFSMVRHFFWNILKTGMFELDIIGNLVIEKTQIRTCSYTPADQY